LSGPDSVLVVQGFGSVEEKNELALLVRSLQRQEDNIVAVTDHGTALLDKLEGFLVILHHASSLVFRWR
jgi:hypothetical protein